MEDFTFGDKVNTLISLDLDIHQFGEWGIESKVYKAMVDQTAPMFELQEIVRDIMEFYEAVEQMKLVLPPHKLKELFNG